MIAYTRDEIISASEVARNFSSVLNNLMTRKKERVIISKNNKLEAVVIPIETYERMQEAFENVQGIKNLETTN
ncbi:type II toxin-antitoxin system Phd/YefM family antitoxin [Sulfurimonas sp.]|uniref:type II toxin-antitoxin system Phd/YefM family antitoxin n=1 Tax=Sulfurimonas sp. TaxID=2022749 RepID=UPI002637286E|nr:type II toxin-antitoxin system Phd/YefM family antitoxin [Sulfurimonas sp.]